MQHLPKGTVVIRDDKLIIAWRLPDGTYRFQMKRVSKSCPLSPSERRAYMGWQPVRAVRQIKAERGCTLSEALAILNIARGQDGAGRRVYDPGHYYTFPSA